MSDAFNTFFDIFLSMHIPLVRGSHPEYLIPIDSNIDCIVPSSPYLPCKINKAKSTFSGILLTTSIGSFIINSCTSYLSLFIALSTDLPEFKDTSRSDEIPPIITTTFFFIFISPN